jgi:hypothetical protein
VVVEDRDGKSAAVIVWQLNAAFNQSAVNSYFLKEIDVLFL